MHTIITKTSRHYRTIVSALVALTFLGVIFMLNHAAVAAAKQETRKTASERIITLHDDGIDKGFITKKATLREALKEQKIRLDSLDRTEPGLDEKLVAGSYQVNVYRARPVIIREGNTETKIITSYRTPRQIAVQASMVLHDEDAVALTPSNDPIEDGAAEVMTITRATVFTFDFYGKSKQAYTMARTVGDMLKEKGVAMSVNDEITPAASTPIASGMSVRLWRNGIQTLTLDEDVAFPTKQIANADQLIGYEKVETPGEAGRRTVTYEINMQNGVEISRKEINSVTTKQPVEEVKIVGTKPNGNGLTKAKGVFIFTDSNGVTHRETYYDLPMNRVMVNCGAGGHYTVRPDGAKIDAAGYVIVAAHLGNYPRCSVVETSIGPGKVYDTGGFVDRHPHGFDLATDWTKGDGI